MRVAGRAGNTIAQVESLVEALMEPVERRRRQELLKALAEGAD